MQYYNLIFYTVKKSFGLVKFALLFTKISAVAFQNNVVCNLRVFQNGKSFPCVHFFLCGKLLLF